MPFYGAAAVELSNVCGENLISCTRIAATTPAAIRAPTRDSPVLERKQKKRQQPAAASATVTRSLRRSEIASQNENRKYCSEMHRFASHQLAAVGALFK